MSGFLAELEDKGFLEGAEADHSGRPAAEGLAANWPRNRWSGCAAFTTGGFLRLLSARHIWRKPLNALAAGVIDVRG